jgi:hypothetical protein
VMSALTDMRVEGKVVRVPIGRARGEWGSFACVGVGVVILCKTGWAGRA